MHPHEDLVRRLYAARAAGDLETYFSLVSDDIVVNIPGRSRGAGVYRGKDEARRHFEEVTEWSGGSWRVDVHDVLASEEHVVALLNASGDKDGKRVELPRVAVLHIKDGKVSELWVHPLNQYEVDQYWGSDE